MTTTLVCLTVDLNNSSHSLSASMTIQAWFPGGAFVGAADTVVARTEFLYRFDLSNQFMSVDLPASFDRSVMVRWA